MLIIRWEVYSVRWMYYMLIKYGSSRYADGGERIMLTCVSENNLIWVSRVSADDSEWQK